MSMLAEPNLESPANVDATTMYRDDPSQFRKIAHRQVRLTLEPELAEQEEKRNKTTTTTPAVPSGGAHSAQGQ